MFANTQDKTQISSSHQLITLASSLRHRLDLAGNLGRNFEFMDQEFFQANILDRLITDTNITLDRRLQAIIKRAEKKIYNGYDNNIKYVIESLLDNSYFNKTEHYINLDILYKTLKNNIRNGIIKIMGLY